MIPYFSSPLLIPRILSSCFLLRKFCFANAFFSLPRLSAPLLLPPGRLPGRTFWHTMKSYQPHGKRSLMRVKLTRERDREREREREIWAAPSGFQIASHHGQLDGRVESGEFVHSLTPTYYAVWCPTVFSFFFIRSSWIYLWNGIIADHTSSWRICQILISARFFFFTNSIQILISFN